MFRRKKSVHLTPLQQGLKTAVSLNYYKLTPIQEDSIDRMDAIGLLDIEIDGSIIPTKMGFGMISGAIETNEFAPPFIAGLYNQCASEPESPPQAKGIKRFFRRKTPPVSVHLTPFQRGLKKAVSLNYYDLTAPQMKSVDHLKKIGLLKIEINGSIIPTKAAEGIIDGTIETNDNMPPFLAGLI